MIHPMRVEPPTRSHKVAKFIVFTAIALLFFFYLVPIAFENPSLHIFAGRVRAGNVPVILVHGLGSAPVSFLEMQERLEADGLYVNGGESTKGIPVCRYAQQEGVPMSYALSFYTQQTGRAFNRLGKSLSRNIDSGDPREALNGYARLLARRIDQAKKCGKSDQFDMVAYSMGGVIVGKMLREQNITGLRHLILLGVPQREGLYGSKSLDIGFGASVELGDIQASLDECKRSSGKNIIYSTILSRDLSLDCQVLEYGLLVKAGAATFGEQDYTTVTIGGDIDGRGDGLIELQAVQVEGQVNHKVTCEHNELRSPGKCEEAYFAIKQLIAPGEELQKDTIDRFFNFMLLTKLKIRTSIIGS